MIRYMVFLAYFLVLYEPRWKTKEMGAYARFAHLPLLLKPDGNGKLSKRDGDRLGFPVFPLEWAFCSSVFFLN